MPEMAVRIQADGHFQFRFCRNKSSPIAVLLRRQAPRIAVCSAPIEIRNFLQALVLY